MLILLSHCFAFFGRRSLGSARRGRQFFFAAPIAVAFLFLVAQFFGVDLRDLGHRFAAADDHVAQHRVVEPERARQLFERRGVHFDVHQHVVRFVNLLHGERELPATPVFETVDFAVAAFDQGFVAVDHPRHLIALIGMHEKHDFVMSHCASFMA
jgi:hypothetical protein